MPRLDEDTNQNREESLAAMSRERPMKRAQIEELRDAYLAAGTTFRADCDGRCVWVAGSAVLGDLTRLLNYHGQYGYRGETLRLYAKLSKADRDWKGAVLDTACNTCPNHLDFASLPPRNDRDPA